MNNIDMVKHANKVAEVVKILEGLTNEEITLTLGPFLNRACYDDFKQKGNDELFVKFLTIFTSAHKDLTRSDLVEKIKRI